MFLPTLIDSAAVDRDSPANVRFSFQPKAREVPGAALHAYEFWKATLGSEAALPDLLTTTLDNNFTNQALLWI